MAQIRLLHDQFLDADRSFSLALVSKPMPTSFPNGDRSKLEAQLRETKDHLQFLQEAKPAARAFEDARASILEMMRQPTLVSQWTTTWRDIASATSTLHELTKSEKWRQYVRSQEGAACAAENSDLTRLLQDLLVNHADTHQDTGANRGSVHTLQFDGVYASERGAFTKFLRFYADGTVITVTTNGKPDDVHISKITTWFNKGRVGVSKGTYSITANNIEFVTSNGLVEVEYKGSIDRHKLKLDVLSRYNRNETTGILFEYFPILARATPSDSGSLPNYRKTLLYAVANSWTYSEHAERVSRYARSKEQAAQELQIVLADYDKLWSRMEGCFGASYPETVALKAESASHFFQLSIVLLNEIETTALYLAKGIGLLSIFTFNARYCCENVRFSI